MNNIAQKNVILKLRHTSDMPYRSIEYVNQYSECANLTHTDINNSMRQLLENDLYIENQLNTTSSYAVGPKTDENFRDKPDGYKAYGNIATSESLEVLHKVDKPLSGTIQRIQSGETRFVTIWRDTLFIGRTNQKLQYSLDTTNIALQTIPITATGFYQDDARLFFSATDGVYQLSTYIEENTGSANYGKTQHAAAKLNSNGMSGLRSVHLNKNTWKITAGGETCVYQGQYDPKKSLSQQTGGIKFESQTLFDQDGDIVSEAVDALGSDGEVTIAGTQSGVFQPVQKTTFNDSQSLYQYSGSTMLEKNYSVIAEFDGNVYVGAENGLFCVNGNRLARLGGAGGEITDRVVDIKVGDGVMYVATSGGVHSVSKALVKSENYLQKALPDNRIPSSAVVQKILVSGKQVYVGTSQGLYCFVPDDVVYISEICVDGSVRQLPVSDTASRFGSVRDMCLKNGMVMVGTNSGVIMFRLGQEYQYDTKVVKQIEHYKDARGAGIQAGSIIKILYSIAGETYVVAPGFVCNSTDLQKRWKPAAGETIADAAFAEIDGVTRILAVTNVNTYVLQLGSGPVKIAQPATPVPGTAVASNTDIVIVAGSDGKCRYVYKSLDSIKNATFKEFDCGISQFEHFAGDIYGVRTDKKASRFWTTSEPVRSSTSAIVSYAWSTIQNGYLFIRDGSLVFKGLTHEYAAHEEGDPELEVSVLADAVDWCGRSDLTFAYVDNTHDVAYVGYAAGMLSAALGSGGSKISKPVFSDCVFESECGRVYGICKGYTGASEAIGAAYSYGEYTILKPIPDPPEKTPTHIEAFVRVSDNESILVAAHEGLFEFKPGSEGTEFKRVSTKRFKAISSTPKLFAGVGLDDNKIYTFASASTDSVETVSTEIGIAPGTKEDPVQFVRHTVSEALTDDSISAHTQPVPPASAAIHVFDVGSSHIIYVSGGKSSIIKNTIANSSLQSFQFQPSQYGYVQSSADITTIQPPEGVAAVKYGEQRHERDDTYSTLGKDAEGRDVTVIVSRPVYQINDLTYNPVNYILFGIDAYAGYVLYANDGVYTTDRSNVVLSQSLLSTGSGSEIIKAVRMSATPSMLFIACGSDEGLQTANNAFTRNNFVVDRIEYADGNYYFKTLSGWRYMPSDRFMSMAAGATAESAGTSMSEIFAAASVPVGENATFSSPTAGTVYVGTTTKGMMRALYFTGQAQMHTKLESPSSISNINTYSLCTASRSNDIMVIAITRYDDGQPAYQIYDFNLATNDATEKEYKIGAASVSKFNRALFASADGSGMLYVTDKDGRLYYTTTDTFSASPAVGDDTFNDMAYVYAGTYTYIARNGKVLRFASIGVSTAWTRLADTGAVNQMCDIPGGKCLIAASDGIWYYNQVELTDDAAIGRREGECVQIRQVAGGVKSIGTYVYDGQNRYIYATGQNMLSSSNYKLWKPALTWRTLASGGQTGIATPYGIHRLNGKTFFMAANNGSYMTKYDYNVVQDIATFTKDDALNTYSRLFQTSISGEVSATLSAHVRSAGGHAQNAVITQINQQYLNVDLDNLAGGWSSSVLCSGVDGYVNVTNDLINEMYFGEYADGDVTVAVSSYLTPSSAVQQEEFTYIMKRWSSGVTELYVSVPTVSSYYIANCFGASNCKYGQSDAYARKNLEQFGSNIAVQNSTLSTHWTSISVGIASASYHIDDMLDIQINGMSLPLAVYKDYTATGDTGIAGRMYRSYIEPSLIRRYDVSKTDSDGNYVFEFACFGTDAQAIKIMFYDKQSRSASYCVKVVFDPNGGSGKMPSQKFAIVSDPNGKTIIEQKELRPCRFTNGSGNSQKTFVGWSVRPQSDNSDPTYTDTGSGPRPVFPAYRSGRTFEDLMEELGDAQRTEQLGQNETIRLYAVWANYSFSASDTTLMMQSDMTEFYIDSVGVDTSTKLGNRVLINFGD